MKSLDYSSFCNYQSEMDLKLRRRIRRGDATAGSTTFFFHHGFALACMRGCTGCQVVFIALVGSGEAGALGGGWGDDLGYIMDG